MKFGKRVHEESEGIPLAPLIDIVFLTLVFFMTTAVYSNMESEIDIQLPTASSAERDERTHTEIYINLREDGSIVLNNRVVTIPELQDILYRLAKHSPGGAVIIHGDKRAALGKAISIMDCCKNADIQNISFSAIKETREEAG